MPPPPMDETSVRVAARIRPISGKEKLERCSECVKPLSRRELVMMGKDRQFTFDHVFGSDSEQHEIYDECVSTLVENFLAGYNATVLAYGQTGSGKTYTMGSTSEFVQTGDLDKMGIIPRAMQQVFDLIAQKKQECPKAEFYLRVQFLELYGEDIHDLLDPAHPDKVVSIREADKSDSGGIQIVGASEETVTSTEDMLETLERGTMCRTTASTEMNQHSSRSHAIFTIVLEQHLPIEPIEDEEVKDTSSPVPDESESSALDQSPTRDNAKIEACSSTKGAELEYRTAKFHFVDLAGSERAKRTGAQGLRLREGININKGLLALGNVISALGDETKRSQKFLHVPYRDSKLTRMLQDSLGGNSRTLMITCVSPADSNYEETLNALRYANRARNIKNKPVVNRDPASSQIASLKQQVAQLKAQLLNGGIAPDLSQLGKFGLPSEFGRPSTELELNHALERASAAESELQRITAVLEKEKRLRSELNEKFELSLAEVNYYKSQSQSDNSTNDSSDREGGDATSSPKPTRNGKEEHINGVIGYIRQVQQLQEQLRESDEQLANARRQIQRQDLMLEGDTSGADDMFPSETFLDDTDDLSDNFVETVLDAIECDEPESQVTEDDDEQTRKLKLKIHENQQNLRESVKRYDVELRNKELLMKRVKEEQLKYEAMKLQYEKKMKEMNDEVKDTQAQRDDLDEKIRALEKEKMTEQSKTQVSKLRAQLKSKTDRLKELESRAKELDLVKRNLERKNRERTKLEREIENIKRQKVEYQRKMEDTAKRYREETKQRRNEIAQLKKQTRKDRSAKTTLEAKNAKAANMLKMKSEQVAALQKRIRDQKKFAPTRKSNVVMTEQEKRHRKTLEKWAQDRIQRDEEFERLERALKKKEEAVERAERVLKELEHTKRAAELRAKAAEEIAVKAQLDLQNHQRHNLKRSSSASAADPMKKSSSGDSSSSTKPARSSSATAEIANDTNEEVSSPNSVVRSATPPIVPRKMGLKDLWKGVGSNQGPEESLNGKSEGDEIPDDYLEAIRELESRLEAAEDEIDFHESQYRDACSKYQRNKLRSSIEEDEKQISPNKLEAMGESDDEDGKLPFQFHTLEEASTVFKQVIQMYMESKKDKLKLLAKLDQLKPQSTKHANSRRSMGNFRRNTILGTSSPTVHTGLGFRGRFSAGSPGTQRYGRWSPTSPSALGGKDITQDLAAAGTSTTQGGTDAVGKQKEDVVLGEKLRESHEIVQELLSENKKLRKYMLDSGKVTEEEIDELLAGCRVDFLEERIRQMQALTLGSHSPPPTSSRRGFNGSPTSARPPSLVSRNPSPNRAYGGRSPGSSPKNGTQNSSNSSKQQSAPSTFLTRKKNEVFQRLYDPKNFTGVSKRRAFENNLVNREKTVDSMTIVPEEDDDDENGQNMRDDHSNLKSRSRSESPSKSPLHTSSRSRAGSNDIKETFKVQPPSWFAMDSSPEKHEANEEAYGEVGKFTGTTQSTQNGTKSCEKDKENESTGEPVTDTSSAFTTRAPGMVFDRLYHSKTGVQRVKAEHSSQQQSTASKSKEPVKKHLMESLAMERRKRRRAKVERAAKRTAGE